MKTNLFTIILMTLAFLSPQQTYAIDTTYPDPTLTPGAIDHSVTEENIHNTICQSGYTDTVRNVSSVTKKKVVEAYLTAHPDWPKCKPIGEAKCEIDHFISLELGGANNIENLFPEPWCLDSDTAGETCFGAHEKDVVENYLHRRICKYKDISLKEAQDRIKNDWVEVYREWKDRRN